MGNKKTISFIMLALLVLGLVLVFFNKNKSNDDAMKNLSSDMINEEEPNNNESTTEKIKTNLSALLGQGKNLKCTWTGDVDGAQFGGTTYIAGNKFAGSYEYSANGQNITSNMVGDGTMIYMWSNLENNKFGFKMDYSKLKDQAVATDDSSETPNSDNSSSKDVSAYLSDYNYECDKWQEDSKVFELPSDVQFVDQTEMMNDVMKNIQNYQNLVPQQ